MAQVAVVEQPQHEKARRTAQVIGADRQLPESGAAPQVGEKAPDFTLTDSNNKPVTLAQLLAEPG
jgi:peroxiredoxin